MPKLLYVGEDIARIDCGSDSVNKRNIDILKNIFGDQFILTPLKRGNSVSDKLKFYIGGLDSTIERQVLKLLASDTSIQFVFISQSLVGRLAKAIKRKVKRDIVIICFYHNIEKHYAKEFLKTSGLRHYPFYIWASFNESRAVRYSDINIVLNERDGHVLESIYQKRYDLILPAGYRDQFEQSRALTHALEQPIYLFVGTAFFGNLEGIEWFIENILPNVEGKLIIIGKGMDAYKEKYHHERLEIYGFMEDLSTYYYNASLVIAPIFSGGGMKTKTAEALMYGKTIVGTKEAFEGYVRDDRAMIECNKDNFLKTLQRLEKSRIFPLNDYSRGIFVNYYSNEAIESALKDKFKNIDIK
ncbi:MULTISPECIES: glycosyltransferase [Sphingobacterium]|uniref:glycosyltransferase n=1 Tax=Sphingobacterium TaxID=28453 RepID=UPI00257E3C3E|nr:MULTISPECIES: glycosyltransferase [Sphingobacterium]